MSARIYLEDEIQAVLAQAKSKLEHASKLLSSTEANVKQAIKAHQVPTEVNGVGVEGYQAAGVLIAEAIAILTTLGADASTGLPWPVIVAIGSPATFDRVHIDTIDSSGDKGVIDAYASVNGGMPSVPFGSGSDVLAAGDKLKIINCPVNIGNPENLPSNLAGMIVSVDSITTDGGSPVRPRILLAENWSWYDDDQLTQPSDTDPGGESASFEARVVYR